MSYFSEYEAAFVRLRSYRRRLLQLLGRRASEIKWIEHIEKQLDPWLATRKPNEPDAR